MKKIFLLFLFICIVSFSEFEFGDLKWGSTKEETKDYLVKTFGINRDSMQEHNNNQLRIWREPVTFADINLKEVVFEYNSDGELKKWTGETGGEYEEYSYIRNYLKKKYALDEKKVDGTDTLTKHIKDYGSMLVFFENKKIVFINKNNYYYLKNYKK